GPRRRMLPPWDSPWGAPNSRKRAGRMHFGTKGKALAAVLAVGLLAGCGSSKSSSSSTTSSTGSPATGSASAYRHQLDAATNTWTVPLAAFANIVRISGGQTPAPTLAAAPTFKSATDTYASRLQALTPPSSAVSLQ